MGRAEVGTPKYLANKMKAKGLQKLRWYCQMCQKQCRDENGFKCHTMSESHQRQLLLFADNSKKYMDEFSFEFAKGFIDILRHQYSSKRVLANRVYQEYIADRNHVHMNSTKWLSLNSFVHWLAKTEKCEIEETERGWYITYINRDSFTIMNEEKERRREKAKKDDEERALDFLNRQIRIGLENEEKKKQLQQQQQKESDDTSTVPSDLIRENDEKIVIPLKFNVSLKPKLGQTASIFKAKNRSKKN